MFSPPKVPINRSRKRKEQCRKTTTAYWRSQGPKYFFFHVSEHYIVARPRRTEPKWRHIHWEFMSQHKAQLGFKVWCLFAGMGLYRSAKRSWRKMLLNGRSIWKHQEVSRLQLSFRQLLNSTLFWKFCRLWLSCLLSSQPGLYATFLRTFIECRLWLTMVHSCALRPCLSSAFMCVHKDIILCV